MVGAIPEAPSAPLMVLVDSRSLEDGSKLRITGRKRADAGGYRWNGGSCRGAVILDRQRVQTVEPNFRSITASD